MKKILFLLTFIMLVSFSYAQEDVSYYLDDDGYSNRTNAFAIDLSHLFKNTLFVFYEVEPKNNLEGSFYSIGLSLRNPKVNYIPILITDGFGAIGYPGYYQPLKFYPKFIISEFQITGGAIQWIVDNTNLKLGLKGGFNYRLSLCKDMFYQDACMLVGSSLCFYNRVVLSTHLEIGGRMYKFPNIKINENSFDISNRLTLLLSYKFSIDKF